MGGTSYRAYLPTTAGEWKETRVPFEDFKLQAFGRGLPAKALNPDSIASVGFTLADKKEGPFALDIEYVKASGDAAPANASGGKLVKADIAASNGIIHVIDEVLVSAKAETGPLKASELIDLAIERGVPIFNNGDVAGCAGIYEITGEALLGMENVPEESRKGLIKALKEARAETSARQRAWILRGAIDTTRASLK